MNSKLNKEHLKVAIVGHVDHGKSTIVGRLLADTKSLPQGKLESIKEHCRKNSKPFEYAFLLDALKDEQSQGITIDMARCFFKTEKRNYIIIDAPGHIEFLKNMCTGAAKADSAVLVIDAKEGIQENSRRHGYMLSMLGVKQIAVVINKIDLVNYDEVVFKNITEEYKKFLDTIGVTAVNYIPISAIKGDNIVTHSSNISWYEGPALLEQMEMFSKSSMKTDKPLRFPVQDIYKFTEQNDARRIVAGTIESGIIKVGDQVVFLPSGKDSTVKSIEGFNVIPRTEISSPYTTGITLDKQIFIKPGEIMYKRGEIPPLTGTRLKATLFWLGKSPMIKNKRYKLKLASSRVTAELVEVIDVLDASELSSISNKQQFDRHDVGKCIIETAKPIAFDDISHFEGTARFVIVDDYEIAGGGIILERDRDNTSILDQHIEQREFSWEKSLISERDRSARNHHKGQFIVFTGENTAMANSIAKELEYKLFNMRLNSFYMGMASVKTGLDSDINNDI